MSESVFPMFSSRSFIVSGFTFRSKSRFLIQAESYYINALNLGAVLLKCTAPEDAANWSTGPVSASLT